jgi:hypothetical protein
MAAGVGRKIVAKLEEQIGTPYIWGSRNPSKGLDCSGAVVPYFSISGDPEVWPFGQLVRVAWFDGRVIEGRVVDTGSHFKGSHKVYRAMGREPLDLDVASKSTKVLTNTSAVIVRGDHFDKAGRDIVAAKFKGQTVVGALHMLGAKFVPLVDCVARGEAFSRGELPSNGRPAKGWSQPRLDLMGPAVTPELEPESLGGLHMMGAA